MTLVSGTACDVGSTPATSSAWSLSMYARMPSSSSRIRSLSSGERSRRARRATCSTSARVIRRSATSDLLEMGVLQRQALAAHAREVDGGDHVFPLALQAHEEPLAVA